MTTTPSLGRVEPRAGGEDDGTEGEARQEPAEQPRRPRRQQQAREQTDRQCSRRARPTSASPRSGTCAAVSPRRSRPPGRQADTVREHRTGDGNSRCDDEEPGRSRRGGCRSTAAAGTATQPDERGPAPTPPSSGVPTASRSHAAARGPSASAGRSRPTIGVPAPIAIGPSSTGRQHRPARRATQQVSLRSSPASPTPLRQPSP